jgi:hypothetical protein
MILRWRYGLWTLLLSLILSGGTQAQNNDYELPTSSTVIFTDRQNYAYGDPIYFWAVIRDQNDFTYMVPSLENIFVLLIGPSGAAGDENDDREWLFLDNELKSLSPYGTVSGYFTAPDYEGSYSILITTCPVSIAECWSASPTYQGIVNFTVGPPLAEDLDIQINIPKTDWIAGETLRYETQVVNDAGRPRGSIESGGFVSLNYYAPTDTRIFPHLVLESGFQFYSPQSLQGPGDAYGREGQSGELFAPRSGTVEQAQLTAHFGDMWRTRTFSVAPARVFTGLRPENLSVSVDQAHIIDLLAADTQGFRQSNQQVKVIVERVEWRAGHVGNVLSSIDTFNLVTDSDGRARIEFIPTAAGAYSVRTETLDEAGRTGQAAIIVFAHPAQPSLTEWIPRTAENDRCDDGPRLVEVILDQPFHRPGEQMQVLVINPSDQPQQARLMVERGTQLLWQGEADLTEDGTLISIPVLPSFAPASLVTVRLEGDTGNLDADGWAFVNVEPVQQRLQVEVTLSNPQPQAGETVTAHVQLTNSEGQPAQAEVIISLVREGAHSTYFRNPLIPETVEQAFYPEMRLYETPLWSYWTSAGEGLFPSQPDCIGDGPGLRPPPPVFASTRFWRVLETDANGTASVTLRMPARSADWRLEARAVTRETQVGEASLVFSITPS